MATKHFDTIPPIIKTTDDVRRFFELISRMDLAFHPDDDFGDYINIKTHQPTFTSDQVEMYNEKMDDAFEVCEKEGVDIYDLGMQVLYPNREVEEWHIRKT